MSSNCCFDFRWIGSEEGKGFNVLQHDNHMILVADDYLFPCPAQIGYNGRLGRQPRPATANTRSRRLPHLQPAL